MAQQQLSDAKAIVQSLCEYFYQQRQKISLLTFGNQQCQWLIRHSKTPMDMVPILSAIQAGGGTPLRRALLRISAYLIKRKHLAPAEKQKIFLITDARSRDKVEDINLIDNAEVYVLDSENSAIKLNKAQQLAKRLGAIFIGKAK